MKMKRLSALAISLGLRGLDLVRQQVERRRRRSTGVVLYYHAIKPHQRRRFARQMDTLLKSAYTFQAHRPEGMKADRLNAAVTFDDGFRSVVDNAIPELTMRNIPFTIFVPTGSLGKPPSWVHDAGHSASAESVVSAADLRVLARIPLATLGSHSVTHRSLVDLKPDDAEQELVRSRAALKAAAGAEVDLFSFPHGAYNTRLLDQARLAGYRKVFTIEPTSVEAHPGVFTVGRVLADPDDWPIEFRLKIAGAYRWRHYFHRLTRAVGH